MSLDNSIEQLYKQNLKQHFTHLQKGIEKESLRIDKNGMLAQTPHPSALGSPLTHSSITTDYSEALLELVTPAYDNNQELLSELTDLHAFVYQNMGNEKLWVNSMPCLVKDESQVPIARYGKSNSAKMRETYRLGLGHRYGRLMQIISGIHFNFSLPDSYWQALAEQQLKEIGEIKTQRYLALIRNFHRHAWLIIYLFGASPAVCKGFIRNKAHKLQAFDMHSLYAPYGTSLRMSDLGYSNENQSAINVSYNHLEQFIDGLRAATTTKVADYEKIGVQVDGQYRQLNSNILQIENEFYSVIRPKPKIKPKQRPLFALTQNGIEYVEVRCLDLNPWLPNGIDDDTIRFLECFLVFCHLAPSPELSETDRKRHKANRLAICYEGRNPDFTFDAQGQTGNVKHHGEQLFQEIQKVAAFLDDTHKHDLYSKAVAKQQQNLHNPDALPSAQILQFMRENDASFYEFAMHQADKFANYFSAHELDKEKYTNLQQQSNESIQALHDIENNDTLSFEEYLHQYFSQ